MQGTITTIQLSDNPLIGLEAEQKYLQRILQSNNADHAYLFLGPRHCGGTSLMRSFALAMEPVEQIDLCAIESEKKHLIVTVKQIQELRAQLSHTAHRAGIRIVCIPDASQLTNESSNALLKVLEEPPVQTVFLIRALTPVDIYPTILSRCAVIRLHQPCVDAHTIRAAYPLISDAVITQALRLSLGRIGAAIRYCSDAEAMSQAQLRSDARSSYGSLPLADRLQACNAFSSIDIEEWIIEVEQTLLKEHPISPAVVAWYQALIAVRKDLGKSLRDQSAWTAFCLCAEPCILQGDSL